MADVFISYAREDQPFVRELAEALTASGKDVWVDWEMPDASNWREEARTGIEASDSVVFVITGHSVESENCLYELGHAQAHSKRIITLRKEPLEAEELPPSVAPITWIDFADGTDPAAGWGRVLEAVDRDPAWVQGHTRWLQEALDWDRNRRDKSYLASGTELNEAEAWLTQADAEKEPPATPLHYEFILAGRQEATRTQRRLFLAVIAALAVTVALGANWLLERNEAREQQRVAISRLLASEALGEMNSRLDRGLLLSAAAWSVERTPEARDSVLAGLRRSAGVLGFHAHATPASAVAFDPGDRRVLASGASDGVVRIWSGTSRRPAALPRHAAPVRSVSFSSDGRLVASVDTGGRALVRDLRKPSQPTNPLPASAQATTLAFSPRGTVLALGTLDGAIALWQPGRRASTVRVLRRRAAITTLSFSADGSRLAAGADIGVLLLEIREGRAVGGIDVIPTDVDVSDVALSPTGQRVAAALVSGDVVVSTRSRRWTAARALGAETNVVSVAVGRLGHLVTGSADGSIMLWSQSWDAVRATFDGHGNEVSDLAFDRTGTAVASAGADGMVVVWTFSGTPLHRPLRPRTGYGHLTGLSDVVFSPSRRALVAADSDRVVITPLNGGDAFDLGGQPGGPIHLAVAEDPPRLAAAGERGVVVWPLSGAKRRSVTLRGSANPVATSLAASMDGSLVAAGTVDGSVRAWTLPGRAAPRTFPRRGRRPSLPGTSPIAALAISPNGQFVAFGNEDGVVGLWDVDRGTLELLRARGEPIAAVAFSPDGRLLAFGGDDEKVVVRDLERARRYARVTVHAARVSDVVFSPDGSVLVSSDEDGRINFWDVANRRNMGPPLELREGTIEALTFNPDGSALAVGANSGSIFVWSPSAWDPDEARARVCALVGRDLTEEERRDLIPEDVRPEPCPS